jgi:hypothetical protein
MYVFLYLGDCSDYIILCTILSDYIINVLIRTHINAFVLVPVHTTAYCRHIGNNCLSFIEGVRIFDN